jgi:hypothetical protein
VESKRLIGMLLVTLIDLLPHKSSTPKASGPGASQNGGADCRPRARVSGCIGCSDHPSAKRVLAGTGKARSQAAGASSGLAKTSGGVRGCSVVGARKNSLVAEQ